VGVTAAASIGKTLNLKTFSIYYNNIYKKSLKHLCFKPETLVV
jgi:hypothetical protein